LSEPFKINITATRLFSVFLFLIALSIIVFSSANYIINIYPKYHPISRASSLLYRVDDAFTVGEKEFLIEEATRLYLQEAQTNSKPLLIGLKSLTPQSTTEEFEKVRESLSNEFAERAFGPYAIPCTIEIFTFAVAIYLVAGKYKHLSETVKVFAFTFVGTSELYIVLVLSSVL